MNLKEDYKIYKDQDGRLWIKVDDYHIWNSELGWGIFDDGNGLEEYHG